jgi:hypothetical protein
MYVFGYGTICRELLQLNLEHKFLAECTVSYHELRYSTK